jgi:Fur family ferric uptake transcriptional regulator
MATLDLRFDQYIKQRGYSITKPRRAVFQALLDKEPQTMQQLTNACWQIDRASVYRTIALFEELGIVHRLPSGWKYKLELTGSFSRHHHHLTCVQCGRVIAFDESLTIATNLEEIARSKNFHMKNHQLEIQGLCQNCQLQSNS